MGNNIDIAEQLSSIRTFNTAKKYAEEILFPKMDMYQAFFRQCNFGAIELSNALSLPPEIRDIERINGLKGMAEMVYSLLISISSTVRLNNRKEEVNELENCLNFLDKIREIFYKNKGYFFVKNYNGSRVIEELDLDYFEKIKKVVNSIYINTEILMTKNKLLFNDNQDEFLSDKELLDKIKSEYVEN